MARPASRLWLAALALLTVTVVLLAANVGSQAVAAELPAQPLISPVPTQSAAVGVSAWRMGDYKVEPLARYDVTARVLSAKSYSDKRESEVSPIDFALGWGAMADREMLSKLNVQQRDRWYFVKWRGVRIDAGEVIANSANTHIIPANPEVAARLAEVRAGDIVNLRGYLVKVSASDGWSWLSSTRRDDTGDGSCEVLWVEDFDVYADEPIAYASVP